MTKHLTLLVNRIFPILLFIGLGFSTTINIPTDYQTIQEGIDIAEAGDTILVSPGTYVENLIWNAPPGVKLFGSSALDCIIDGNNSGSVLRFGDRSLLNPDSTGFEDITIISNFTLKNGHAEGEGDSNHGGGISIAVVGFKPIFENLIIENNYAHEWGGGIYSYYGAPSISNSIIKNNDARWDGGGIYVHALSDTVKIDQVEIINNTASHSAAIYSQSGTKMILTQSLICNNSSSGPIISTYNVGIEIDKCTIANNQSEIGALFILHNSGDELLIDNCILWGNQPIQAYIYNANNFIVNSSNIESVSDNLIIVDNSAGIYDAPYYYSNEDYSGIVFISNNGEEPTWGNDNINQNPLFCDPSNLDFTLAQNSPSVGISSDGSPLTMGAYDVGCEEVLSNVYQNQIAYSFRIEQNYPNPFNPITTLKYELPEDSFVDVTIYDMLGNVVNNLVNANQSSGYKSIQWDATNNQDEPVSAGVYLYKIQAGNFVDTKKMILLK